jgi:phenylalanyl-tRNA synthetase beta chain
VNPAANLAARPFDLPGLAPGRAAELLLNGEPWGWLGEIDRESHAPLKNLKLRDPASIAEVDFEQLVAAWAADRKQQPLPEHPAVSRDFNFVLDQHVSWDELTEVVRKAAGPLLEAVDFVEQYQGQQIAAGKKSYVLSLTYRAPDRTLTGTEIDHAQTAVLSAVQKAFGATQR